MKITQIQLNGLDLISADYYFSLLGLFDMGKDVISNDLFIDGDSFNRSKIKGKKLVLNGMIRTYDVSKIVALNQALAGKGLKKLLINVVGMGLLTANVEILSRITGDNSRKISIQLSMTDPYLYDSEQQVVTLGALSNSSLVLPTILPFTLGSISGGQGTITNYGNAVAYPIIIIVGTCDTITVTNSTTNESMSINISLQDSDTLIIDNTITNRGVYLNENKRMDLKNGSWFSCTPGDNIFSFSRNSLQTKQHCAISLQSRWI